MKAFTLVELLVGIGIISMIAGLSMTSYPKFSEQVALTSEVYKILAFAKETQIFGTAAYTTPGTKLLYSFKIEVDNNQIKRYKWENPTTNTNDSYVANSSEDTSTTVQDLKSIYKISQIEGILNGATTSLNSVFVFYKRPNPEARIVGYVGTTVMPDVGTGSFSKVIVTLQSRRSDAFKKKIVILQTGQAYVQDW